MNLYFKGHQNKSIIAMKMKSIDWNPISKDMLA